MTEMVKWVHSTPGDLADGRPMGPGDIASDVSLTNAHNKDLFDLGRIVIVGSTQPENVPKGELAESELYGEAKITEAQKPTTEAAEHASRKQRGS